MSYWEDFNVGGLPDSQWFDMFHACHDNIQGSIVRMTWPDGDPYTKQENLLVQVFQVMRSELHLMQTEKNKRG